LPPEALPVPADKATFVLSIEKTKEDQSWFSKQEHRKGITQKYLSLPMILVHP
jgi:hypothetical protein